MNNDAWIVLTVFYVLFTGFLWYAQIEHINRWSNYRLIALGCIFWPVIIVMIVIALIAGLIIVIIYYIVIIILTLVLAITAPSKLHDIKIP